MLLKSTSPYGLSPSKHFLFKTKRSKLEDLFMNMTYELLYLTYLVEVRGQVSYEFLWYFPVGLSNQEVFLRKTQITQNWS
jgi:hypothetical protein